MIVIGVDEVGRGALAGDLIVCAFAFLPSLGVEERAGIHPDCRDSKSFSSRAGRSEAASRISGMGVFTFCRMSPDDIDRLNIHHAVIEAMGRAALDLVGQLDQEACVIVDGKYCPPIVDERVISTRAVIKADAIVPEVAAASILAKVARDTEMDAREREYPGYGFSRNAGYGSPQHLAALKKLGLCGIHRSWARKFVAIPVRDASDQVTHRADAIL